MDLWVECVPRLGLAVFLSDDRTLVGGKPDIQTELQALTEEGEPLGVRLFTDNSVPGRARGRFGIRYYRRTNVTMR